MRAVVRPRFGGPEVLEVHDIDEPTVDDTDVLVRVRASSVNPAECYAISGTPYVARPQMGLRRPKDEQLGADFAGTVERVGESVRAFRPGDDVFGGTTEGTAFAELVVVPEDGTLAKKPESISFDEAGTVATAGITALQAMRDHGGVREETSVVINGASGGVGTFAVQIANALGADVTGVCSTGNVELVRSLGADHVVDYTREDFTRDDRQYDVLVDVAGSRSWSEYQRVLKRGGTFVIVGGPKNGPVLGPLRHIIGIRLGSIGRGRNVMFFIAKFKTDDLLALKELLETGTVRPIVDRRYDVADVAEAFRYLGEGHARANVVLTFDG